MKPTQEQIDRAMRWLRFMVENPRRFGIDKGPPSIHIPVIYAAYRAKCEELEAVTKKTNAAIYHNVELRGEIETFKTTIAHWKKLAEAVEKAQEKLK